MQKAAQDKADALAAAAAMTEKRDFGGIFGDEEEDDDDAKPAVNRRTASLSMGERTGDKETHLCGATRHLVSANTLTACCAHAY